MIVKGEDKVNIAEIKECAGDLRNLLEEADLTERKGFLRSFVKRIEVDKTEVKIRYKLPVLQKETSDKDEVVYLLIPLVRFFEANWSRGINR